MNTRNNFLCTQNSLKIVTFFLQKFDGVKNFCEGCGINPACYRYAISYYYMALRLLAALLIMGQVP